MYFIQRLIKKSDISGFINNSDLNEKIKTLATKAELKPEKDEILKFQVFDSNYFHGKSNFEEDGPQNYWQCCSYFMMKI